QDLEVPLGDPVGLPPEGGEPEGDVELEQLDAGRAVGHVDQRRKQVGRALDACSRRRCASVAFVSAIRIGPARVPSRESPEQAVALLRARSYTACEIDCEGGFWMDYPFAERFGELARAAGIVLS